MREGEKTNRPL